VAAVFLVHWNEAEAKERAAALRKAGHRVDVHWSAEVTARIAEPYPDAVVISLDRLPSHGRAVAEWVWEAKKRQTIPILFSGGKPEKVADTRAKFPKAIFCSSDEVAGKLKGLRHHR